MTFYERLILKKLRKEFKNLTVDETQKQITLCKHTYLALIIANQLLYSNHLNTVISTICILDIFLVFFVQGIITNIVLFITAPIIILMLNILLVIMYKCVLKKQPVQQIKIWLVEKIQNVWLLDWHVISIKDWITIRKKDRTLYDFSRSEKCNHECYYTADALATTLKNPDIKILWLYIEPVHDKCGHAVLAKNNKIYDSNRRRTYNRHQYFSLYNAEVFKEFSMSEYVNRSYFTEQNWEEFGEWCKVRNAARNN